LLPGLFLISCAWAHITNTSDRARASTFFMLIF
jgi:hypothetical protein